MIQEIVLEWLIILIFGISPSELPSIEDFNSQLSSLQFEGLFSCQVYIGVICRTNEEFDDYSCSSFPNRKAHPYHKQDPIANSLVFWLL